VEPGWTTGCSVAGRTERGTCGASSSSCHVCEASGAAQRVPGLLDLLEHSDMSGANPANEGCGLRGMTARSRSDSEEDGVVIGRQEGVGKKPRARAARV